MSNYLLTLTIGVLLCTSSLNAQTLQQPADTTLDLNEIVVQASKLPVSPRETSRPVLIIDRRQIEQNSGSNVAQLLHQYSGIRVNNSMGSPANNQDLYLQGASSSYTLILLDGIAVNDPSGIGGAIDLRLLPIQNIDRIEVLKGNQSTLYGSDALAGVINIITNEGSEKILQPTGTVEYGAYNSIRGSADLSGSVKEILQYSFGYSRRSSDGISAATTPVGSESFENDGYQQDSFSGNVTVRPVESISIKPFLKYSVFDGDFDADAFTDAPNKFKTNMWNPGVQFEMETGDIQVNSTYQLTKTEREFSTEFGETLLEGTFHNFDTFLNYDMNTFLNVMAGFNWQEGVLPADQQNETPEVSTTFSSPYATLLMDAGNGLRAEAGFRMNIHSEYGNNSTYSFSPSYQVSENFKLFGSVGTGFKTPTLDQLFGQFGANPDLEPEESRHLQVGFEYYMLNQTVKIESHFFDREIDNLIAYDFSMGYINRDREETQGIEVAINWLATKNLSIGGFYNYLNGETITLTSSGEIESSNDLIRIPDHNIGLHASYQFSNGLNVKLDGEYSGERTDLFFNPSNNYAPEEVTLDSYVFANIYAEYSVFDQSMTLYGTLRNLFDSDFTEVYGYNTMGIHAKAGVRFTL